MKYRRLLTGCLCMILCCISAFGQKKTQGKASYYSDKLHGRTMSNGERYHRDSMTCAHLNYPLGTMLRVRNPINNKEVIVKVTDRGPFSKRYIIDLSKAAARELGFIRNGFCQVEITPIHPNRIPFRPEDKDEIPELHLEYMESADFPNVIWKQEAELKKKKPEKNKIKRIKVK